MKIYSHCIMNTYIKKCSQTNKSSSMMIKPNNIWKLNKTTNVLILSMYSQKNLEFKY